MSQRIFLTLNRCKKTLTVTTEFLKKIELIPKELRKSLTLDNGKEFTGHTAFNLLGLQTYFCDAHSPGQKPLVEKMNSMIHRIYPKKTDIKTLTKRKLLKIENILNNMPRKNLNYKTHIIICKLTDSKLTNNNDRISIDCSQLDNAPALGLTLLIG